MTDTSHSDSSIKTESMQYFSGSCSQLSSTNSLSDDALKELVIGSMSDANRLSASICYPILVQKSYGNEKRLACPPPIIKLTGGGWSSIFRDCGDNELFHGDFNGVYLHVGFESQDPITIELNKPQAVAIAGLFTSDAERRRKSRIEVQIHKNVNQFIGRFSTDRITIFSKPSIKQTLNPEYKYAENEGDYECPTVPGLSIRALDAGDLNFLPNQLNTLALMSGMEVCIFCRTRSQSMHTIFLHTNKTGWNVDTILGGLRDTREESERPTFTSSSTQWSKFKIYLKKSFENSKLEEMHGNLIATDEVIPGTISCGSTVILCNEETGLSTPPLMIEKVDLAELIPSRTCSEKSVSVCQLQKYSLYLLEGNRSQPLFLTTDRTGSVSFMPTNGTFTISQDSSGNLTRKSTLSPMQIWMFVVVNELNFTWSIIKNPERVLILTAPYVHSVSELSSSDDCCLVEVLGKNFVPIHVVYFGALAGITLYRNDEMLLAIPPKRQDHLDNHSQSPMSSCDGENIVPYTIDDTRLIVPVTIVKYDGIAYPTNFTYTYDDHNN